MRILSSDQADFAERLAELISRDPAQDPDIERAVAAICDDVRSRGDAAVLEYTQRYDGLSAASVAGLELSQESLAAAMAAVGAAEREALEQAAARVRSYHERQLSQAWEITEPDGTVLGQRVSALERVGLYVPGGKAAYPSSVLMNAIPARVAGVDELVMTVPTPGGEQNRLVLAAARIAGVDRVFTIGGAQAVAALAYGTQTIPRVDKIVGPGNAYVAAAKRRVFGAVGIDMIAGPSEILVICDGSTDADWIAMDMFAQAEHDELAQALLLCPDASYIEQVAASIERLIAAMARREVIAASLARRGALVRVRDLDEACALANRIAPEHLELSVADPDRWLGRIRNAGAVFVGRYSSESLGDYCAGPNHVLPTSGTARYSSPLGVYDFQKRSSLIRVSRAGAQTLGRVAATLARGEGLMAHALSAEYRLDPGATGPAEDGRAGANGAAMTIPEKVIREDVRAMVAYHVTPARGMVKLDAMENPYGLPAALGQEVGALVASAEINRYPDPAAHELKARIRSAMQIPAGFDILLGNGSDEIIQLVVVAAARPGAVVMAPEPTFVMYRMAAAAAQVRFVGVPLAADFTLDLGSFLAAMAEHRPSVVFLAWPNNPTGNLFQEEAVARIVAEAPGLVVVDEAYQAFAGRTLMARLDGFPNLLLLRTASKLGLAGLRLGYAAARPEWMREFEKLRPPYNVGVLAQMVGERLIAHHGVFDEQAAAIRAERGRLARGLAGIRGVQQFPSDANFILVRVPDAPRVFEGLKRRMVLVRFLHGSHALLDNCLRLTVGTPGENEQLLGALAAVLAES